MRANVPHPFSSTSRNAHARFSGRALAVRTRALETNKAVAGASPRVRGTPKASLMLVLAERFIPACAGNALSHSPRTVHPRVRGERFRRARH
jgi:hypothetical protein